jgi:small subunit ribosomal protein S13
MLLLKAKNWSRKTLEQNLKNVYGLSFVRIKKICHTLGFQPSAIFKELGLSQKLNIYKFIEKNIRVESFLKRLEGEKKKFLENTKSIRGYRSKVGLPVRGQRTHTNGRTKRRLKNKNV